MMSFGRSKSISFISVILFILFSGMLSEASPKAPDREKKLDIENVDRDIHIDTISKVSNADDDIAECEKNAEAPDGSFVIDSKPLTPGIPASIVKKYFQMVDSLVDLHDVKLTSITDTIPVASTINGGINSVMARLLLERKEYKKAYQTYRLLLEKYGHLNTMSFFEESVNGLLTSGNLYSDELKKNKKIEEAREIMEYVERLKNKFGR